MSHLERLNVKNVQQMTFQELKAELPQIFSDVFVWDISNGEIIPERTATLLDIFPKYMLCAEIDVVREKKLTLCYDCKIRRGHLS